MALFVAFFRETYVDRLMLVLCMLTMSIASLLYIIAGQFLVGQLLRWFPISGFDPNPAVVARFLALPVLVGVVSGFGADTRLYRTIFLEEIGRDYVRTARAKGCGDGRVMVRHVLRNALIPILTNIVIQIPFLFTGALLLESFFGIPGLGALTVEAIVAVDRPLVAHLVPRQVQLRERGLHEILRVVAVAVSRYAVRSRLACRAASTREVGVAGVVPVGHGDRSRRWSVGFWHRSSPRRHQDAGDGRRGCNRGRTAGSNAEIGRDVLHAFVRNHCETSRTIRRASSQSVAAAKL